MRARGTKAVGLPPNLVRHLACHPVGVVSFPTIGNADDYGL